MEAYRSGHNGHDWKSCSLHGLRGSNPLASAKKRDKNARHSYLFFLTPSSGSNESDARKAENAKAAKITPYIKVFIKENDKWIL